MHQRINPKSTRYHNLYTQWQHSVTLSVHGDTSLTCMNACMDGWMCEGWDYAPPLGREEQRVRGGEGAAEVRGPDMAKDKVELPVHRMLHSSSRFRLIPSMYLPHMLASIRRSQ
jgi:hypothetical protein